MTQANIFAPGEDATHFLYPDAAPRFVLPTNSRALLTALWAFMSPHEWLALTLNRVVRPSLPSLVLDEATLKIVGNVCSPAAIAVYLGTPGPHNKSTLLLLNREGNIFAFCKIADRAPTAELLKNETFWLQRLARERLAGQTPGFLGLHTVGDRTFLLQTPLTGRRPFRLSTLQLEFLKSLQALGPQMVRLEDSRMHQNIVARFSAAEPYIPLHWARRVQRGLARLKATLPDRLLVVPAHRDFVWWNMVIKNGSAGVYDWEYADEGYVPAYDIFHFKLFPKVLRGRLPRDLDALCASTAKTMEAAEFPREASNCIHGQFIAYLLDIATWHMASWQVWRDDLMIQEIGVLLDRLCAE